MKLKYIILYVQNVPETVKFYRNAFGLTLKMQHESNLYAELDSGETTLAFSAKELMQQLGKNPASADHHNPQFELAFEVGDVAAALETAVSHGATLIQSATRMEWGQIVGYVADRNGFLVEICTPVNKAAQE